MSCADGVPGDPSRSLATRRDRFDPTRSRGDPARCCGGLPRYTPAAGSAPASHQHLHHWVFLIDQAVNDYEEIQCADGTMCEGSISAYLPARQMGLEDIPAKCADQGESGFEIEAGQDQ